jgi:hypothetical protein
MASAEELVFDKNSEYQIIEEFEFEEEVQRPESIRFFTYEEQASDFIEKLLPTTGRIAKSAIRKAEYEVDSFTRLHSRNVKDTEEGFAQQEYTRPTTLPWVHYRNRNPVQYTEYGWTETWDPLFSDGSRLSPNYYLRLLDSLPKSGRYFAVGDGVPVYTHGRTDIESYILLDRVPYTKTMYREDGSYSTTTIYREDTQDVAKFTNYVVDNPPITPPAPLADHPFLSVHPDPVVLDTTEPLPELLPTLEAIFTHAVPETPKPYTEGLKYLKIFDIALRDVPDKLWTSKFPPEASVDETPPPQDLTFPSVEADAPSKNILDVYKTPWYPSLASRKWLNSQVDGGVLVAKMLLSQAGNVGVAAIPPPVVFPEAGVIDGTPDDCLPPEITGFNDFLTRGVYRAPKCANCGGVGHRGQICPDKAVKTDYKSGYGCFPLSFINNERADDPYTNKSPWVPGTDEQILKDHQQKLQQFKDYYKPMYEKIVPSAPAKSHNETRLMIVSILDDETKTPEDQVFEIEALVKDAPLVNHTYTDKDTGEFLVCEHELEILRGSYAKDPKAFLKTWCVKEAGYYVCQYSGERVSDVIEMQEQFDEQGRMINHYDQLDQGGKAKKDGSHHMSFASSLKGLQAVFKLNSPGEDVMYLLLSLIQVIPEDTQLKVLLDYVRRESDKLRSKIAGKKLTGKQTADVDMALSIFGFNAVVILLQIHRPQLIPRRSFGSKPLVLRGFPRDTDDMNDSPLVDSLLNALINTFESYPSTFKGSSVVFLRTLLNDRKATRRVVLSSLKNQFAKEFSAQLIDSKDNLEAVGVGYVPVQSFAPPPVLPKKAVNFLSPGDSVMTAPEMRYTCMMDTPWITPSTKFSFNQAPFMILDQLKPSPKSRQVLPLPPLPEVELQKAEIARRLKLKGGDSKMVADAKKEDRPGILLNLLLRCLTMVAEETVASEELRTYLGKTRTEATMSTGDPSLMRDIYKGFIFELGQKITENQAVLTQFERAYKADIPIRALVSTAVENRKAVDAHKALERDEFRLRLRRMPDALRDITSRLIDLGLAPYLITKDDRESFMRELQERMEGTEPPTDNPLTSSTDQAEKPEDVPEEGLNDERDVGADGEVPMAGEQELEVDYGDYGDRRARTADGEEVEDWATYED